MITARKIERFMILRQIGLLRTEGKATSIDYSLFCVCSEGRTVYCSYYIHKIQDIMEEKIMEATGKTRIYTEGRLGKGTS